MPSIRKPTKIEIKGALLAIDGQLDLINDIARTEGHIEARKCATSGDAIGRMRGAITTLKLAGQVLPERLSKNMNLAQQFGWI